MRTGAVDELTSRVGRVFARLGLPEESARIMADHLVEADMDGSTPRASFGARPMKTASPWGG